MSKFISEIKVSDWEIETDEGWKDFNGIGKTDLLNTYNIILETGITLTCSDDHILFDKKHNEIPCSELTIDDYLYTIDGNVKISSIYDNKEQKYLYDILDVENERYYTNGILSHNCGKTVSVQLYLLWYILFSEHKHVGILANKGRVARKILKSIKQTYEYIPHFLQQGIKIWNVGFIELENGCSIIADTTSISGLSSESINILYIDEVALIPQDKFWAFYDSNFPTISSFKESKIFLSSTSKGLNHWYKIWTDAIQKRNGYNPIRVYWQNVPGRDEAWKQNEIAKTSELSFAQEQDCNFLGSALTLVDGKFLSNLTYLEPIHHNCTLQITDKFKNLLHIYDLPIINHIYTIGLDSSEMQEDSTSDSISIQVIDITSFPFVQGCSLLIREGISYLEIPDVIVELCKFYNDAVLFIEANSTGLEIGNLIVENNDYENIYYQKGNLPGFKTSTKTKKLGCSNLKMLIENDRLILKDFDTISQLSTFIKKGASYKADLTYKDDAVSGLLASIFFMQDKTFEGFGEGRVDYVTGIMNKQEEEDGTCVVINPDNCGDSVLEEIERIKESMKDFQWMFDK